MSTESRKVLQLLAEGKITIDDAERLLDKLAQLESPRDSPWPDWVSPAMQDLPAGFFESLFRP